MRYRAWWQRAAEMLHPFEHHVRHPKAALCFAVLRHTRIDPRTELGRALLATARGSGTAVVEKGDRLVFRSWASHFETALASEDFDAVLDLIHQRPGELSRRLDHLLRLAVLSGTQRVAQLEEMFAHALGRITTPSLLVLGSHFRARTQPLAKRVFFPRGEVLLSWAMQDRRALLPADLCDRLSIVIEQELVRRAGACDRFPTAVIDAELEHLMVPFNQRTASRALIAVPRGSSIPLTEGKNLRLFLHWQQPDPLRVDLDLSAAFYDEHWKPVGQCDYTELTFAGGKAVHSGDFTSAPGPEGASEFVDLDIDALRAAGIRYAVMVVFAFNNVPFELLPRGYAGYMTRHDRFAEVFDARTVEQRFDLMGASRTCAPMVVDLKHRRIVWLDVHLTVSGTNHAVHRHSQGLGHLSSDVLQYFQSGSRPTLWQLACLHAASRCDRVLVRLEDGRQQVYRRADGESAHRFLPPLGAARVGGRGFVGRGQGSGSVLGGALPWRPRSRRGQYRLRALLGDAERRESAASRRERYRGGVGYHFIMLILVPVIYRILEDLHLAFGSTTVEDAPEATGGPAPSDEASTARRLPRLAPGPRPSRLRDHDQRRPLLGPWRWRAGDSLRCLELRFHRGTGRRIPRRLSPGRRPGLPFATQGRRRRLFKRRQSWQPRFASRDRDQATGVGRLWSHPP